MLCKFAIITIYAFLCKVSAQKLWSGKSFDKYHVWQYPMSDEGRYDHGLFSD